MALVLHWFLQPWLGRDDAEEPEEPGPNPCRDPGIETLLRWRERLETGAGVFALGDARRDGVLRVYIDCLWWPNAFLLRRRLKRCGYIAEWRDVQRLWLSPE
jgi:hypothetical protein